MSCRTFRACRFRKTVRVRCFPSAFLQLLGGRNGERQSAASISDSIEGYEVLSEIHRGGQGVVYKAIQQATKRTVALKVLLEGPYASAKQRLRFEREIDLVAGLRHPNIVTVYDSGVTRDRRH